MEELRSTEILDKEIQNDARKKAQKILEKADADCQFLLQNVKTRLDSAEAERKQKNIEKINIHQKNLNAALPLEKERFLVSYVQNAIEKACDNYLTSLSLSQKIDLLKNQLKKYVEKLVDKKITAYFYGLSEQDVKKVIDNKVNVVRYEQISFGKLIVENDCGLSDKFGIILEDEDLLIRVRLTISELVSQIQEKYRWELYNSLFDGRLEH